MNQRGGDDLEDDFIPDDLVAFDDGGEEGYVCMEEDASHLLSDQEREQTTPTTPKVPASKKRKRTGHETRKDQHKKVRPVAHTPSACFTW
jgi:hypothetical protein